MIYTVYAENDDMTFIVEEKPSETGRTLSVIGFYFGEPEEGATKEYMHSLTAELKD